MREFDRHILWSVVILVIIGTVMIFSATSATSKGRFGDSAFFLKRQIIRVIIGFGAMYLGMRIDYHLWQRYAFWMLVAVSGLLILPLIPQLAGIGAVKGANRWVRIFGSSTLQPSELAKFALIVFVAEECSRRRQVLSDFRHGILPIIGPVAVVLVAILLQPNFGMVMGLLMVVSSMLIFAGVPMRYFVYGGIPAGIVLTILMLTSTHAYMRLKSFFSTSDPLGDGYQALQSLIAIGSGGFFGLGLGQGKQKIFYLPEAHTDFIFAVIGEELGFLGTAFVILVFAYLVWRGLRVVLRAPDRFGAYVAFGIISEIMFFALINLGVVTRLIPTTGIPLPFISYGGSQLLVHMFMAGVLLNISASARRLEKNQVLQLAGERCAT